MFDTSYFKTKLTRALNKNKQTLREKASSWTRLNKERIVRLHRRVSHYRVIRDVCPCASLISIHWRRAKLERVSHYMTHLRRALRVRITDLIASWGP
jgi:hypothetical protein